MKVLPGETSLRLEVFRPDVSFSWKAASFQALSLDFTRLAPGLTPSPSQSLWGWGSTDLLHSQRKFPTDANCIFKAIFLAEPWLQPILSPSLQLLPGPTPVPHAMGLFVQPDFGQKQLYRRLSSLSQDLSQQRGAALLQSKLAQPT